MPHQPPLPDDRPQLRRIAVSRLHLPDGRVLRNQVIELEGGTPVRHYPLLEELPATEWLGGDFHLDP